MTNDSASLSDRIDDHIWDELTAALVFSVTSGGLAAMGYYRNALWDQSAIEKGRNPSTLADIAATATILRTLDTALAPMSRRLGTVLSYFAEETRDESKRQLVCAQVPSQVADALHTPELFFSNRGLRVIVDGVDGTGNFDRWVPLFCSAAALLVDDQVRLSAVYDPIHHVVYYGTLRGPKPEPERKTTAWLWDITSGNRTALPQMAARKDDSRDPEAVSVHISRTNIEATRAFLRPDASGTGMLERLAVGSGGTYALNSGILQMASVARGSLGAYANIVTSLWDIAAGEVLVRATGGKVTDFQGQQIDYSDYKQTSVLAAKAHLHDSLLATIAQTDSS